MPSVYERIAAKRKKFVLSREYSRSRRNNSPGITRNYIKQHLRIVIMPLENWKLDSGCHDRVANCEFVNL